jgi:hypothetical protein
VRRFISLFTLAMSSLALVGLIAIVTMWVRSYVRSDTIAHVDDYWDGLNSWDWQDLSNRRPSWAKYMWHDEWEFRSRRGLVSIRHNRSDTSFRTGVWLPSGWHCRSFPVDGDWRPLAPDARSKLARFGISFEVYDGRVPLPGWDSDWSQTETLCLPYWLAASALLLLSAPGVRIALRTWRRRRRSLHNLCVVCGYDLRATPERCPECGTAHAVR